LYHDARIHERQERKEFDPLNNFKEVGLYRNACLRNKTMYSANFNAKIWTEG
jgi:hypothetical protein